MGTGKPPNIAETILIHYSRVRRSWRALWHDNVVPRKRKNGAWDFATGVIALPEARRPPPYDEQKHGLGMLLRDVRSPRNQR